MGVGPGRSGMGDPGGGNDARGQTGLPGYLGDVGEVGAVLLLILPDGSGVLAQAIVDALVAP